MRMRRRPAFARSFGHTRLREVVRVEGVAVLVREDPGGQVLPAPPELLRLAPDQPGTERLRELLGEVNTTALAALRGRQPSVVPGPAHLGEPASEVDVAPLERHGLADPHP